MDIRAAMKLSGHDRFFPSQNLLPQKAPGRMRPGKLIALPLRGAFRANFSTEFADPANGVPHDGQREQQEREVHGASAQNSATHPDQRHPVIPALIFTARPARVPLAVS